MFDPPPELPNQTADVVDSLHWLWLPVAAALCVGAWWLRRPTCPSSAIAVASTASQPPPVNLPISPFLLESMAQVSRRATPNARLRLLADLARLEVEARRHESASNIQTEDRVVESLRQLHSVMWASYLQQAVCLAAYLAWRCRPEQCPTGSWSAVVVMCMLVQWAYVPLALFFLIGALTNNHLLCIGASLFPLWYIWDRVVQEKELLLASAATVVATVAVHAIVSILVVVYQCKPSHVHLLFFVVLPATALVQIQVMNLI